MEKFEVILSEDEKAKNLSVVIDYDNKVINFTGTKATITITGREVPEPLSHSHYNNSIPDLESLLVDGNLSEGDESKLQLIVAALNSYMEATKPLTTALMQTIYNIQNNVLNEE